MDEEVRILLILFFAMICVMIVVVALIAEA
jgi:hypothetical protein